MTLGYRGFEWHPCNHEMHKKDCSLSLTVNLLAGAGACGGGAAACGGELSCLPLSVTGYILNTGWSQDLSF